METQMVWEEYQRAIIPSIPIPAGTARCGTDSRARQGARSCARARLLCSRIGQLDNFEVTGLDISRTFLDIARENARAAGVRINFQHGSASEMPLSSDYFDFLLCRAAFKNFTEPVRALNEMYRVLKPGGKAWIIDLRRDASPQEIGHSVDAMHLGSMNGIVTKLTFRFMLLKRAYSKPDFERLLTQTPFQSGKIRQEAIGFEAELTKGSPTEHSGITPLLDSRGSVAASEL